MHFPYIQGVSSSYDLSAANNYGLMAYDQGFINLPDLVYPSSSSSSLPSSLNSSPRTPHATITDQTYSQSLPEKKGHIPRPRNAFIIFRSQFALNYKARQAHPHQNLVSRDAAEAWNKLSEEAKLPFKLQADEEKREHRRKYPNYTYMPGCKATKRGASANAKRSSKPYSPPPKKTHKASKAHDVTTASTTTVSSGKQLSSPVIGYISIEEMLAKYNPIDTVDCEPTAPSFFDRIDPQFGFRPELTYTELPPVPEHFFVPADNTFASSTTGDSFLNPEPLGSNAFSSTLFNLLYHVPAFEDDNLSNSGPDHVTCSYGNEYQNLYNL